MFLLLSTYYKSPLMFNNRKPKINPSEKVSFIYDQLVYIHNDTLKKISNIIIIDPEGKNISKKDLNKIKAMPSSSRFLVDLMLNAQVVNTDPINIIKIIRNRPVVFYSALIDKYILSILFKLIKINTKIVGYSFPETDEVFLCNKLIIDTEDFIKFLYRANYTCQKKQFEERSIFDIIGITEEVKAFIAKKVQIIVLQGSDEFLIDLVINYLVEKRIKSNLFQIVYCSLDSRDINPKSKIVHLKNVDNHPLNLNLLINDLKTNYNGTSFILSSKKKIQNRIPSSIRIINIPKIEHLPDSSELFIKLAFAMRMFQKDQLILQEDYWKKFINKIPSTEQMNNSLISMVERKFYFQIDTYDTWYFIYRYIQKNYRASEKLSYKRELVFTEDHENEKWKITGNNIQDITIGNTESEGFLYIVYLIKNYVFPNEIDVDELYNKVQEWIKHTESNEKNNFTKVNNAIRYALGIDKRGITAKDRKLFPLSFLLGYDELGNKINGKYIFITKSMCYYNPKTDIKIEIK